MKRLVLFSDGQNTRGDLDATIGQMAEESVAVHFRKTASMSQAEAAIKSLKPSSSRAFFGEVVRMNVELSTNRNVKGKLRMVHKGVAVQEQAVQIFVNEPNRFILTST